MATTSLYGQNFHMPVHDPNVAVTYNAQRNAQVGGGGFWQQGAGADISASFYHGLGAAASISGDRASNIGGNGVNLTTITYLFGPRYTLTASKRRIPLLSQHKLSVFGQALFGAAHGGDSVFPSLQGAKTSANSFAFLLGGGIDLPLTRRFSLRPIELDWLRTRFPNASTDVQDNLRLSAGLVIKL